MSKINFKCFGDNIFSLLSPTMKNYTTLEFDKESVIKQIKSGIIEYSNIQLRKDLNLFFLADFYIIDMLMKSTKITIPDDKEHFKFEGTGITIQLELKSFNNKIIETQIKDMLKEMSRNFMKEAVDSMDKNSKQPTFWDNIEESLYKNLIFNMRLCLKGFTLYLTRGKDCFTLSFDQIDFNNETGITRFQGAKISFMSNKNKLTEYSIIDKCTFETHYNKESHLMKLHTDTMKFNINPKVYQAIMDLIQESDDNTQKLKCYKRRANAAYSKPQLLSNSDNKKDYYIGLWKYAITTVVRLRKYSLMRWYTIFDLSLDQYEKLACEYYSNNKKEDNLLLMKKHIFLLYSRTKAKETILQNKQKPAANPLMNLFLKKNTNDKSNQEPASLSNEENAILDRVYSKQSIKEFIKGDWSDPIFLLDKMKLFMSKIGFDILIQNFHFCINNNHSTLSFNLNHLSYDYIVNEKSTWWESYNLSFNEIGNFKSSLYKEKTKQFLIKIKSYAKTDIQFGFEQLFLNIDIIEFFLKFLSQTYSHSWDNVFIKRPRKREFRLSQYTFDSIPNISFIHKINVLMLKLYSLGCVNPSELVVDFELKEKLAKKSIIARNKIVLAYFRERKNNYVLQINDVICFISMPIVYLFLELMTKGNVAFNKNNKQLDEDIKMNNIEMKTKSNEGSFNFKYKDIIFRFETMLSTIQISFIENESKHSLMLANLQIIQRENELIVNIDKSFISFNKQSTILFLIFYNQFLGTIASNSNIDINRTPSPNSNINQQSSNYETSILFQTNLGILEFQIDNSTLQLMMNNMMVSHNNSKVYFNSKISQLTYLSRSFHEILSLVKMQNDLIIEYSSGTNSLFCKTSNPFIQLDLPIIDQLINIVSEFQLILNQDNIKMLSTSCYVPSESSPPLQYNIHILTPKMMFNRFKFEIAKLEITNVANFQSLNVICSNFLMSNEKIELIRENKLTIDLFFNRINELYCEVFFNYLQIYFLQKDITNLISSLDYDSSLQEYQRITRLMGSNECKDIDNMPINNYRNSSHSNSNASNKQKHLFIKIPKCEIDFSLNTKEKLLQVSSEGILFDIQLDHEDKIQLDFRIVNLLSSFNQFNNTKFCLISQNKEFVSQKKDPNILIDLSEFTPQYQLNVLFKDNVLDINMDSIKMFLRADAFFAIFSFFINAIPDNFILTQSKEMNNNLTIKCLFINSSFILQSSFDNKESLIIQIDQFYSLYQTGGLKMPYGELFTQINSLRGEFAEGSKSRKLIYSKNDFLIFKCHLSPDSIQISMIFDTIIINLSYKDIISLLKAYHIGLYFIDKEKRIPPKEVVSEIKETTDYIYENNIETKQNQTNKKEALVYRIEFEIGTIDITLTDNLQNSYYPFLNFNMNKLNIEFINDQIDVTVLPSIYSYNYISCEWEPSLEPFLIQMQYRKTNISLARKGVVTCYVLQDILINLSDMNISLTWGSLSRWIERFIEEKKSYEKSFESTELINIGNQLMITDDIAYISKISNNNICNISGNEFRVIYQGNHFICPSGNKIDLEYLNELEANGNGKEIELIYINHVFKFPIEKMGVRMHRIDSDCFFISEISLTKQLSNEISIYSPVVFHNKTQYGITIVFNNNDNSDSYFMILNPKSKQGVPFNHLKSTFDIYFSNVLSSTNLSLNVSEILNTPVDGVYEKALYIESKYLLLKLVRVLQNVRKMVINAQHVILNYLPCDLIVKFGGNTCIIKKGSAKEIDFPCNLKLLFSINVENNLFSSNIEQFFSIRDQVFGIGFKNKIGQVFNVTAMICEKKTQKVLVLYSEYLIKNNTGTNLNIKSKTKDGLSSLCFKVASNVYLISSNSDIKSSWFCLSLYCFTSNKIYLKDLLSEASKYSLKMENKETYKVLNLNIQTNVSYLPKTTFSFTEMLCTVIFTVQPICKITNLLENKWIFISSATNFNDFTKIPPLTTIPFHFFNNGKDSSVCFGITLTSETFPVEWSDPLYINRFDLYTCCVYQNIFNVEIRQNNSENITDVFITKSTANNSKILIKNLTKYQIAVYQKDNDKYIQIIDPNKKEQFNVYSLNNTELTFVVFNITISINFLQINDPATKKISKDTMLYMESNGLKTYFTFYDITLYNASLPEAKQFNFDLNFASVYISLIGDNKYKDKKLMNYIRNEILLVELKDIQVQILQKTNTSLLNKYNSQVNIGLRTINVFNQISTYGKFAVVFANNNLQPALNIRTDCDLYPNDKICKMNTLVCSIGKLFLGIDPNFVTEVNLFVNNVIYRMNIINFNVDDVFLDNTNDFNDHTANQKALMESYQANSVLYSLHNFNVPQIDFSFELSKVGLKSLLHRQFNFSSILSSILSNLAGETHSIKLSSYLINYYLGTIDNLVSMILNRYKRHLFGECNKIGFKGVLLGITSLFKQKEQESDLVKINRRRFPRPFYGQYKSIKKYDEIHAYIYEMMINEFGGFKNNYFFIDGIRTSTGILLFTTMCLFIFKLNTQLEKMIDYFYIKKVHVADNKVLIEFNQKIDNRVSQTLSFPNHETAEVIGRKLLQSMRDSVDPIQMLN